MLFSLKDNKKLKWHMKYNMERNKDEFRWWRSSVSNKSFNYKTLLVQQVQLMIHQLTTQQEP